MSINIVGMGMGSMVTLTMEAKAAIEEAELIIGAKRLLNTLPDDCNALKFAAVKADEIRQIIEENRKLAKVCILMSGDVGFYSGAKKLLAQLKGNEVELIAGISSVQYFAAKLLIPWQDWFLVSAHGKDCDAVSAVKEHRETFFLTGGVWTVQKLCAKLAACGLGACTVTVGENLGSARELIAIGSVSELAKIEHEELAVMLVDNPTPCKNVSYGLPDRVFLRGAVPMTKSEVRSVILSKLRLCESDIVYDIGAGTGSVAVEATLLARRGKVYAIEREPEGCCLIQKNAQKLGALNLSCIEGQAPEAIKELEAPNAAFIGGSGGKLTEILETLLKKNPKVRLVVSAISLETLAEATVAFFRLPIKDTEIVQVAVSRAKHLGEHDLLMAENPIFIISGVGANV